MMDLPSSLVPSQGEMPFFHFITELNSVLGAIKSDLVEAMEARHNWRDAAAKAMPQSLKQIRDEAAMLKLLDEQVARMSEARPKANVRAAGILVPLQALMEDLRRSVAGNVTEQFGPLINGVPFSHLLQAGANSCRHGSEWWRTVMKAVRDPDFFNLTDAEQQALIDSSWSNEQRRSIEVISKALGVDQGEASNQPAIEVLWLLSDGGKRRVLRDRMVATAIAIAKAKGRLADYNGAATMLGSPPAS
jgi:hypothetical protein